MGIATATWESYFYSTWEWGISVWMYGAFYR